MKKALLYIHGKNGSTDEANRYNSLFSDYKVIGVDYKGHTPWNTKEEFIKVYHQLSNQYQNISIIANSIGAYFVMNALSEVNIERAFFISPIVDMEKLITDMMRYAGIQEKELKERQEIKTPFGETLSWAYLCYVRENPIVWHVKTDILYGENDNLTSLETISKFTKQHHITLTVMKGAEHWFHTDEQMKFVDKWLGQCLKKEI